MRPQRCGLIANGVGVWLLRKGSGELGCAGRVPEVLSDALGSFGVVIAALIIIATGWERIDSAGVVGHRAVHDSADLYCCCAMRLAY